MQEHTLLLSIIALTIGFVMDLCWGDPHWLPHPIALIGRMIDTGENIMRSLMPATKNGELFGGAILVLGIITISGVVPYFVLWAAGEVHLLLRLILESLMCYQILSVKSLKTESMKVYDRLRRNDVKGARQALAMIVGRDVENLTEEQIAKAAVETVAENTTDGAVAPFLFMAIGGAPLGFLYKAINTMDSMMGYKNEQYVNFGRVAARLDDVANYIPARMAALFMLIAAFCLRLDYKNAYRIFKRDRYNHASPNSAQTESVCAGALGIQLAGDAYYFGRLYHKKTIGDPGRNIVYEDIGQAHRILYITAYLTVIFCWLGVGVWLWLI